MEATERLYYALGQLAYAVAKADGKVNQEERQKFHDIVTQGAENISPNFNISEIIFHLLDKQKSMGVEESYQFALQEMTIAKRFLTDEMREHFPKVLFQVAEAFHPVTEDEQEVIDRFQRDLEKL